MAAEIQAIRLGGVNGYLIHGEKGFVLVDTGFRSKRAILEKELGNAGCRPGNLKLIVLTHGDSDHTDNGAYLRQKYGAKIAMHLSDAVMVKRGDMSANRKEKPDHISFLFGLMSHLMKPGKMETFEPDLFIDEDFDLTAYGLEAKVLHLPGHSKGSIGILTAARDLICGDLLYNIFGRPNSQFIDDLADFKASIEKLKKLDIKTVYPGHGRPFPMRRFKK